MAWSGSDILYIINDEMLSPKGELGGRRATGAYSQYTDELSDFCVDQTELMLLEFARGIQRSSTKKTC